MKTLEQREYEYLVSSRRKNPRIVAQTLGKTIFDAGRLLKGRERPYHLGQALYEGCKSISEYAYSEGVDDLMLVDKSARPLWAGIAKYWSLAHPEDKRPSFHFINPASFRSAIQGSRNPNELSQNIANAGIACREELVSSGSSLASRMDKPLMLVDSCLHSGRAVYLTKRVLGKAGFDDIRFGVVKAAMPSGGIINPDVSGTRSVLAARCIRSDAASVLVLNDENSIYSTVRSEAGAIQLGHELRREIGEIITQRYFDE